MKQLQIAHFGAFDFYSFGDTLFADALAMELKGRIPCEITLFSKVACMKPYSPHVQVYSYDDFPVQHQQRSFDAVVIGGGELLHYRDIHFTHDGKKDLYPAGMFWKRIIDLARLASVPVYFIGVGVPYNFTQQQSEELKHYFDFVRWITPRDFYSAQRLLAAGIQQEKI